MNFAQRAAASRRAQRRTAEREAERMGAAADRGANILGLCPDCSAAPGEPHKEDCANRPSAKGE